MNSCDACQIRKVRTNNDLRCIIQLLKSFATQKFKVHIPTYTYVDYIFMDEKIRVHNIKRIIKCTHPFPCQYFNTFKMQNFTPESFRPGVFHSFGTRTTNTQRGNSLQDWPKIHSHSQFFRYSWNIFCLPHQPNFQISLIYAFIGCPLGGVKLACKDPSFAQSLVIFEN